MNLSSLSGPLLTGPIPRWNVFHGAVALDVARVYVEYIEPVVSAGPSGGPLEGWVDGPHSHLAATLPARSRLRDAGPGATRMAQSVIENPCCWTPRMPTWYQVHCSASPRGDDRDVARHTSDMSTSDMSTCQQMIGLRALGCRKQSFRWDRERYVFRLIDVDHTAPSPDPAQFAEWRETGTSLRLRPESHSLFPMAMQFGVPILLDLRSSGEKLGALCHQASQSPAVCMVWVDAAAPLDALRRWVPNLLIAQTFSPRSEGLTGPSPDVWIASEGSVREGVATWQAWPQPIIAVRHARSRSSWEAARGECDRLQRDLAPHTKLGGYATWLLDEPLVP